MTRPMQLPTLRVGLARAVVLGSLPLAAAATLLVGVELTGGWSVAAVLRCVVAVAVLQVLPGALLWRCIRPIEGWAVEDVGLGFALGYGLAIGAQVVAGLWAMPWLTTALLLALLAVLVLTPGIRRRWQSRRTSPAPWWFGGSLGLVAMLAAADVARFEPLLPVGWSQGARRVYIDNYFHLALAGELSAHGPQQFSWVAGQPLAYHWFSHAWLAAVSGSAHVPLDVVLMRIAPVVTPVALVVVLAAVALRLSGSFVAGSLAALLGLVGGAINSFGSLTTNASWTPVSVSLGLGAVPLLALVTVLVLRWQGSRTVVTAGLVWMLAFLAVGTKGSTLPVAIAGIGLALVAAMVFARDQVRVLAVDLGLVLAAFVAAMALLFHGSAGDLLLDPSRTMTSGPVGVGGTLLAALGRAAGLVLVLRTAAGRRRAEYWMLLGAALAGAGAVLLFVQPGQSQAYFLRSAAPLAAVGSAVALVQVLRDRAFWAWTLAGVAGVAFVILPPRLLGALGSRGGATKTDLLALGAAVAVVPLALALVRGRPRQGLTSLLVVAVCVGGVAQSLHASLSSYWHQPASGGPVAATSPTAVTREVIDAARWIRHHSARDDLVMTDRHCVTPAVSLSCDARDFVVAAYAERRVLVEGWAYTPKGQPVFVNHRFVRQAFWDPALLALNDGFIQQPTARTARELWDRGVRWVLVDDLMPHADSLAPFATQQLALQGVQVYRLVAPSSA